MKPLQALREFHFNDDVYTWSEYSGCYYLAMRNWRQHPSAATYIQVATIMSDAAGLHALLYYPAFRYLGAYHDAETAIERVNDVIRKEHEEKELTI
jgi:hypothetical protein